MKKFWIILLTVLVILGIGGYGGYRYFQDTYLVMGEESYRRDSTQLDFSNGKLPDLELVKQLTELKSLNLLGTGITVEQYEDLQAALPGCEIDWELPFQGGFLPMDTQALTLDHITREDMALLAYLDDLETIDATAIADLDTVLELEQAYPEVEVAYQVIVNGQLVHKDTSTLTAENVNVQDLTDHLKYLPNLTDITFTGAIPENEAIYQLKQDYPGIMFHWPFTVLGLEVTSDTTELDLSGIKMESVEALEESLKYFNNLQTVTMCDTGLPSEEIDALWKRHPETRFIWNVKIGNFWVRTDITTLMPFQHGYDGLEGVKLYDRDMKEMKYLVDMVCMDLGHMGIRDLSFLEFMPNLEYLIVADTKVSDITPMQHLKKLKYLEAFANTIRDISPLAGCTALEDVNICHNWIQDFEPLMELPNLKNIWIAGHSIPEADKVRLQEAHPDAKIVFYMVGSTGNGWRSIENYFNQRDMFGMFYMTDDGERYWERKK